MITRRFLGLADSFQHIVLPKAHGEYQEDVGSDDRFCGLGVHALTVGGQNFFVRPFADLESAQKLATKWGIAGESLTFFGSHSDSSISVSRSLKTIFANIIQISAKWLHLKRLILTEVRIHHISTYISFPVLEVLQLMNLYDAKAFMESMTFQNLRLSRFFWVKYTSFLDTETKDSYFVTDLVRSLKHLRHLCIQIPPHMRIKFRGEDGLIECLFKNLQTISLRVGQLPANCVNSMLSKFPNIVSLGIESAVMSMSVSKIIKNSSMWFARDMKALAVSYILLGDDMDFTDALHGVIRAFPY